MMKNIFNNDVTSLQNKSNSIIDVFTKTITDLSAVNEEIKKAEQNRNHKIAELQAEQEALLTTFSSNNKIISKLNLILND